MGVKSHDNKGRAARKRNSGSNQTSRAKPRAASSTGAPAEIVSSTTTTVTIKTTSSAPARIVSTIPDERTAAEKKRACDLMTRQVAETDGRMVCDMQDWEHRYRTKLAHAHAVRKKSLSISLASANSGRVMLGQVAMDETAMSECGSSSKASDDDDDVEFVTSPGAGLAAGPVPEPVPQPAPVQAKRAKQSKPAPAQNGFKLRATAPAFAPATPVASTSQLPRRQRHQHHQPHHPYAAILQYPFDVNALALASWRAPSSPRPHPHPYHRQPQPQQHYYAPYPQFKPQHFLSPPVVVRPSTPASTLSDDDIDMVWESSTTSEADLCTTPGSSPYMSAAEDDFECTPVTAAAQQELHEQEEHYGDGGGSGASATDRALRALRLAMQHHTLDDLSFQAPVVARYARPAQLLHA
ncbi:hypothetical protein BKA62DRAFT_154346 [Auriculariales sp. MPI-PUGE-AT-0066]|nr:hypothetical protein BKA62DRAFT_154346 [Auriculariales sp. MPI-PUGE-AT-0066]